MIAASIDSKGIYSVVPYREVTREQFKGKQGAKDSKSRLVGGLDHDQSINQSTFIYIAPYNNHRLTKVLHNYRNRFKVYYI